VVVEICEQTYRHTDKLIAIPRTPTGVEVGLISDLAMIYGLFERLERQFAMW